MRRILRRVKLDLTKKFGRNLLKCVVFIVLFSMLFSSLYIQNISKNLEDSIISKFDIYAEIDPTIDYSTIKREQQNEETIRYIEIIQDVANNTNESYYDYNIRTGFQTPIKPIQIDNEDIIYYSMSSGYSNLDGVNLDYPFEEYLSDKNRFENGILILMEPIKGVFDAMPKDFELKDANLKRGRLFKKDEIDNGEAVCIVHDNTLKYTKDGASLVEIGDKISISEIVQNEKGEIVYYVPHSFTVIGTYEVNAGRKIQSDGGSQGEHPIYIPIKQYQNISESVSKEALEYDEDYFKYGTKGYELSNVIFKFETIQDFREFLNYLDNYAEEFNEGYKYTSTIDYLYPAISNVLSVSNTISYISYLCLGVCMSITFIVLLFDIDSNRKEIGILMSMGESLKGVVIQYIIKMLIVSCLSISMSFIFTQTIGTDLLTEIAQQNITEESLQLTTTEIQIEKEEYDEILRPLTISESIQAISLYIMVICLFEIGILILLIRKVDPKELMKDD